MWNKVLNIPASLGILTLYLAAVSCLIEDVSEHPNLPLLRNDICGPSSLSTRIANGKRVGLYELPWMALIIVKKGNSVRTTCGGTLINHRYVLTSATCIIDKKPDAVRLGEYNMNTDIDCEDRTKNGRTQKVCAPKPQQFSVEKVIPHPNYKEFSNDIALLRLSGNADLTSGAVIPICLPIGLKQQMANITGLRVDVAGWGVTEKGFLSSELLRTSIRVVERSKCKIMGKDAAVTEICAGGDKDGKSVCGGDAGGPLSLDEFHGGKLRTVQYGIFSIGLLACGTPGMPSIFTNVGYYMKWILDNMEP